MNQLEVRQFVERYFAAFSTHTMETHPVYLTMKLPEEVDKDIGNRPFYWSWVEKMNIPPQPMILTFFFDPEQTPEGMRGEQIHFGAGRLQQIFQSAQKHGRFVCMFEHPPSFMGKGNGRHSTPLTPWLGINVKISFICDKKRDMLIYLGVNLHQPRMVHDFYPFLQRLPLSPSIPDYFYTLDRRIGLGQSLSIIEQEVSRLLATQDQRWSDEARTRLREELEILEAYYIELARREPSTVVEEKELGQEFSPPPGPPPYQADVEPAETIDEYRSGGGRILDFLRMNGIPQTPKSEINQKEWKNSTPQEELERRKAEVSWQYEPRIEVKFINGGLFYLYNMPPFTSHSDRSSGIM